MGLERSALRKGSWEYTFPLPALDIQNDFRTQQPGRMFRLTGVDGRYAGRLKRFPGFFQSHASLPTIDGIGSLDMGASGLFPFWKSFAIQQGPSSAKIVRGVVILVRDSGGGDAIVCYYSVDGGAVVGSIIRSFPTGTTVKEIDMVPDQQLLYFVGESNDGTSNNKFEFVARYTGSTGGWKEGDWITERKKIQYVDIGKTANTAPAANLDYPSLISPDGRMGLAMRFVYPDQGWFGPVVVPALISTGRPDSGNSYAILTSPPGEGADALEVTADSGLAPASVFTRCILQTFRTVDALSTGVSDKVLIARGNLYLESELEVPRYSNASSGTGLKGSFARLLSDTSNTQINNLQVTNGSSADFNEISPGDTVYILLFNGSSAVTPNNNNGLTYNGQGGNGPYTGNDHGIVYRRTVTSRSGDGSSSVGAGTINFKPGIPNKLLSTQASSSDKISLFWVSKAGDAADTSAQWDLLPYTNVIANPTGGVRFGWSPGPLLKADDTSTLYNPAPDTPVGLEDEALVGQPELLNDEFTIFAKGNPRSKLIAQYDGLFFRVTSAQSGSLDASIKEETGPGTDIIRWDFVDKPDGRKGIISTLNRHRVSDLSDSVKALVNAGPFLAAILDNRIIRLHRSGGRIAIDEIHNRHGSGGRYSSIAVGATLYFASPIGVLVLDMNSGQLDALNATQHFFDETGRWRDDLNQIEAAYDSRLGAVIFFNPTKSEALLVWLNHGVLTHLIDVPFSHMFSSPNFVSGGSRRAMFIATSGVTGNDAPTGIYTIDDDRSGSYRTTISNAAGSSLAWNGLCGAGTSGTTIAPPSGKNFHADMIGHYIRIDTANDGAFASRAKITGFSSPNLTVDIDVSPASGDRFSIAGIPLQTTFWPLYGDQSQPLLDMFRVKKVSAIGASIADMSGDSTTANPNLKLRYQLFERDGTTPALSVDGDMNQNSTSATYKAIRHMATVLVPGVECWSSDLDFDLLGIIVDGSAEGTRKD